MLRHAFRFDSGIELWSQDHRGHGQSPGPEGLGDFGEGGWDAIVADIGHFADQACTAHPGVPVILFSHPMGSFATQQLILGLSDSTACEITVEGGLPAVASLNDTFELARTPCGFESAGGALAAITTPSLSQTPRPLATSAPISRFSSSTATVTPASSTSTSRSA